MRRQLQARWRVPPICWLTQQHTDRVIEARADCDEVADACFSTGPQLACAVLTADCLPIILWSHAEPWVAAVHAGWQGLYQNIITNTVNISQQSIAQLSAWVGPSIRSMQYEVQPAFKDKILARFPHYSDVFYAHGGQIFCDLPKIAVKQLHQLGIKQVHQSFYCTSTESQLFHSYRREGQLAGRQATLVWLEKQ